jgi:hypothetical protein
MKQPQKALIDFIEVNGCFECISHYLNKGGYPLVQHRKKRYVMSRLIYEQCFGSIPEGLVVMHKCDNPKCINPEHLMLGTLSENNKDAVAKGRNAKGELNGHSKLTGEQVIEIRLRLGNGERPMNLAVEFNVSRPTMSDIKARRTWKHV